MFPASHRKVIKGYELECGMFPDRVSPCEETVGDIHFRVNSNGTIETSRVKYQESSYLGNGDGYWDGWSQ